MEYAELVKLLLAAVVGGVLKELVSWIIGFSKLSLFGPMWKHSRSVLSDLLACGFYGVLLARFGLADAAITRLDVLITIGCAIGLFICAITLLISVANWMSARETADALASASRPDSTSGT